MRVQQLESTDAFVLFDLEGAEKAAGVARLAPKVLRDSAELLARTVTYSFAVFGLKMTGASAGINAKPDQRDEAIAGFLDAVKPLVADGLSLHASTGHVGLAAWLIRAATWLGVRDDEMELKDHYELALRNGALIVAIEVPTNARRQLAVEILARHGAHTVNYFGRFVQFEYAKARELVV